MTETSGEVRFEGDQPHAKLAAHYSLVGFALSLWAEVESELADVYCALVCGEGGPVEGALSTWTTLMNISNKIDVTKKVMNQVLVDERFNEFRASCKKKFSRIITLSEIRNKIAHGRVSYFPDVEIIVFLPYYNKAAWDREEQHRLHGHVTGTLYTTERWTHAELMEKANLMDEARKLSIEIKESLVALFHAPEHREFLAKRPRMIVSLGVPFQH